MKTFVYTICIAFLTLTGINNLSAQNYAYKLKRDIVRIEAGKYKATDLMFLRFPNDATVQVKMSAESPIDVMSRDNFVSMFSTYGMLFLLGAFEEAGLGFPDIQELDELIGDPDMIINFVMTRNGMQIQVISALGQQNFTERWEDIFKD